MDNMNNDTDRVIKLVNTWIDIASIAFDKISAEQH